VRRSVTAEAVDAAKMVWVDGVRKLPSELHAVELAVGDAEIFAVVTRKNGAYVTEEEPAVACRALYVLHPNDPIKVSWDVVVGVLICYTVASVPLQLAFADSSAGAQLATMDTFDYVIDGFFAGDVVLSFFTAYYDEARDVYVAVHKLIARRYLRTCSSTEGPAPPAGATTRRSAALMTIGGGASAANSCSGAARAVSGGCMPKRDAHSSDS
jgi:hypothetical protein